MDVGAARDRPNSPAPSAAKVVLKRKGAYGAILGPTERSCRGRASQSLRGTGQLTGSSAGELGPGVARERRGRRPITLGRRGRRGLGTARDERPRDLRGGGRAHGLGQTVRGGGRRGRDGRALRPRAPVECAGLSANRVPASRGIVAGGGRSPARPVSGFVDLSEPRSRARPTDAGNAGQSPRTTSPPPRARLSP